MARQDMKTSDKDSANENGQKKTSDKDSTNENGHTGYEDVRQGLGEREWPDRIGNNTGYEEVMGRHGHDDREWRDVCRPLRTQHIDNRR